MRGTLEEPLVLYFRMGSQSAVCIIDGLARLMGVVNTLDYSFGFKKTLTL